MDPHMENASWSSNMVNPTSVAIAELLGKGLGSGSIPVTSQRVTQERFCNTLQYEKQITA
jgi:hypothetical protein